MPADTGGYPKKPGSTVLDAIVDFGPEQPTPAVAAPETEVTSRLRTILKAIEEINRRIDRLTDR